MLQATRCPCIARQFSKMRDLREELEQEASFWRELIAGLEETGSHFETDHLRKALQLVEKKLTKMNET